MQLRESTSRLVDRPDTENLETFLRERAGLVEANDVDLSSDVDSVGRDTEDAAFAETVDGEGCSDGESGWESRRDDDGNEVESSDEDGVPFDLWITRRKVSGGSYGRVERNLGNLRRFR